MQSSCKACDRPVKASGLCHVHLKEASKPAVLNMGSSFGQWQKRQNQERSWKKPVTSSARTAEARRCRTEALALATPAWLKAEDLAKIRGIYSEATRRSQESKVKHEVDHIVPLQGEGVCGLHVPWNLRILTKSENNRKGSKGY